MRKFLIYLTVAFNILYATFSSAQTEKENALRPHKITNDQFANNPFGTKLTLENFSKVIRVKCLLNKIPVSNPHSGANDTIYSFKYSKSIVRFYKNAKTTLFQKAIILDKGIKLANGIEIGMSCADLLKAFKVPNNVKADIILVTDQEDFSQHRLYIKDNKLTKIELNAGMD